MVVFRSISDPDFDWLTMTDIRFGFDELRLLGEYPDSRIKFIDKGNGAKWWLEVSGRHTEYYKYYIANYDLEGVSRIDVCIDVTASEFIKDDFFRFDGAGRVKWLKLKRHIESYGAGGGRTVYFGSNDLILRVYEKGKQLSKGGDLVDWLRFEFQLKGKVARKYLDHSRDPKAIFSLLANRYLPDMFDCVDFGTLVLTEQDMEDESSQYYDKQVLPWLKKQIKKEGFSDQLLKDLGLK